ncbi:uncharacterized protein LOC142329178 [Lycorma delicatula]|uniref:uncharacterized protein LOC142329178 n=1 Tax=Lycorma delicatula TaxID=130591 RepID=UPI003F51219D
MYVLTIVCNFSYAKNHKRSNKSFGKLYSTRNDNYSINSDTLKSINQRLYLRSENKYAESNERSSNNTSKNLKEEVSRVESWCRICQESTSEVLVSPCRCRGTQGLVHLSCLERWLTISGTSACEVCFYQYCVKSVPKYSPFTSIFVWMYKDANKK